MRELFKNQEYRTLLTGEIFLVATAAVLRLVKPVLLKNIWGGAFPWADRLGLLLFVVAAAAFILERWMKLPFFYGRSQRGGSNANSFFLFAIAINCFSLGGGGFALLLFSTVLILAGAFILIYKIRC